MARAAVALTATASTRPAARAALVADTPPSAPAASAAAPGETAGALGALPAASHAPARTADRSTAAGTPLGPGHFSEGALGLHGDIPPLLSTHRGGPGAGLEGHAVRDAVEPARHRRLLPHGAGVLGQHEERGLEGVLAPVPVAQDA